MDCASAALTSLELSPTATRTVCVVRTSLFDIYQGQH